MGNNYKVLLIEDSKIDQIAFKRMVRENSLDYDYSITDSIAESTKILAAKKFDVVIADHLLSDGSAFDLFDLKLDVPVIIITGTGSEKTAINAMKAGAYDYIIKDSQLNCFNLLPVIIENTIKRSQDEKKSRLLSQALIKIRDSVYITNKEGIIIFVNQAFSSTYGYREEEIIGRGSYLLWGFSNIAEVEEQISSQITAYNGIGEFYQQRKDESKFLVSLSCSRVSKNGSFVNVFVVNDLTYRQQ